MSAKVIQSANFPPSDAPALIETRGLDAGYNGTPVVVGLDLVVRPGEVVALLGPNGAGKSTTMMTLAGAIAPLQGELLFDGAPAPASVHRRARQGLAFVTEKRSVFMQLSAADNLRVGDVAVADALALFPELESMMDRRAGLLSGGQQQMLTLARALGRRPRLLLADELSLGLAPQIVHRLLRTVRAAADTGVGVLLVEQHVHEVLRFADRVYVMRRGRVVLQGNAEEFRGNSSAIETAYLSGEA